MLLLLESSRGDRDGHVVHHPHRSVCGNEAPDIDAAQVLSLCQFGLRLFILTCRWLDVAAAGWVRCRQLEIV